MNKKQAGSLGGQATYKKYGRDHMSRIGLAGARSTWQRYTLWPLGTSGWALVDKSTGQVKTTIGSIPLDLTSHKPPLEDVGF